MQLLRQRKEQLQALHHYKDSVIHVLLLCGLRPSACAREVTARGLNPLSSRASIIVTPLPSSAHLTPAEGAATARVFDRWRRTCEEAKPKRRDRDDRPADAWSIPAGNGSSSPRQSSKAPTSTAPSLRGLPSKSKRILICSPASIADAPGVK